VSKFDVTDPIVIAAAIKAAGEIVAKAKYETGIVHPMTNGRDIGQMAAEILKTLDGVR
jgi:hypothetical protein